MEYIIEYLKNYNYKKIIYPILLLALYIIGFLYLDNKINKKEENITKNPIIENIVEKEETIEEQEYIFIDIKGAIKKPGVYKLDKNSRIIDAINISGGLSKNANTNYINLSKILNDAEMIKIYTNEEIKNMDKQEIQKIEECICEKEENYQENKLININQASIEDLKTLNGIGDAKAQSIIDYRNTKGMFQSKEDIKNVEGISETIYEKIKDFITI